MAFKIVDYNNSFLEPPVKAATIVCDTEADLEDIGTEFAPGSVILAVNDKKMFMMNASATWVLWKEL